MIGRGKAIPVQAWTDLRIPRFGGSQTSKQQANEGDKVVSTWHRPLLPPRKYSRYSVFLEAESTPGS